MGDSDIEMSTLEPGRDDIILLDEARGLEEPPKELTAKEYLHWKLKRWRSRTTYLIRALFGEFLCTAIFVFTILGAVIHFLRALATLQVDSPSNPVVDGVATAFIAIVITYIFADISGPHFNPAVTFGAVVTFRMSVLKGLLYIIAQCLGATVACLLLAFIFPDHFDNVELVVVKPVGDARTYQAFFAEVILTFIFIFVVAAVAYDTTVPVPKLQIAKKAFGREVYIYNTTRRDKSWFVPFAVGLTLGAMVLSSGTISGGAFNPARAFGPALVAWEWHNHWIYWVGDFTGAFLAAWTYKLLFSQPWRRMPEFKTPFHAIRWIAHDQDHVPIKNWKKFLIAWLLF